MMSASERPFDVFETRHAAGERHRGYVDSHSDDARHPGETRPPEPLHRATQTGALGPGDTFKGSHERPATSRSHLGHDDQTASPRHDIELQRAQPQVAVNDVEAASKQEIGYGKFGPGAELVPRQCAEAPWRLPQ
jgi:hypothetical protein